MQGSRSYERLLSQNEGQHLEFKRSVSDSLGRTICAFANAGGGTVIVGAGPDGTYPGISNPSDEEARARSVARACHPQVGILIHHFTKDGRNLMAVEVLAAKPEAHSFGSSFFMRVGATSQSMSRDEVIDFLYSTGQVKYEEKNCPNFRFPADFNVRAFYRFLQTAGIRAAKDRFDTLANLGVASRSGGNVLINNAGVLFFAKEPNRFLRQAYIDCVLFQGTEKVTVLDRKAQTGALAGNVDEAMIFLKKHLSVRYHIEGLYRKEILEIPPEALREALLNAVIHRDYHFDTAWITVEVYKDRVEISSPGGLPPGLRPEEFGKKSVHRNRLIAELFQRLGEVERVGAGIRKIRDAVRTAGLRAPRFLFTTFFTITFWRPAGQESAPVAPQVAPQVTPQVIRLLEACATPVTRSELQSVLELADREHFRKAHLQPALLAGWLAMTIPGRPNSRNQKYVITDAGAETLRKAKEGS